MVPIDAPRFSILDWWTLKLKIQED
jgi:hypothetical protein